MTLDLALLPVLAAATHLAGSIAALLAGIWILRTGDPARGDRPALVGATLAIALWSSLSATFGPIAPYAQVAESVRNLALVFLLLRLFGNDGRDESLRLTRPVIVALCLVELIQLAVMFVGLLLPHGDQNGLLALSVTAALRALVAIGGLVLLHNLYAGASPVSGRLLRWSALGLACLWVYDLNAYTIAYLTGEPPSWLLSLRGIAAMLAVTGLAASATPAAAGMQFLPSRAVTFRTLSLLVIGIYLVAMIAVAQLLSAVDGDFGRLAQIGFILAASVFAILWFPSQRLRGWLQVTLTKHLFRHRYDYREEWLRFTRTIGQGGNAEATLHERVVKAMADITDSPAGLLFAPNEEAELSLLARWRWEEVEVPAVAAGFELAGFLEQRGYILDLDQIRAGDDIAGEARLVPDWLRETSSAWAVVPLVHFDRLVGVVVLARPAVARSLDWEDLDLLRVVGQQLASYLAEQGVQQSLMESTRFDEFNRRIAFVMHDIKNLASQLTLLARNAEKHADNPAFRDDMLVTLRNSADKLNTLLQRLNRYGPGEVREPAPIDGAALVANVAARFQGLHPVTIMVSSPCTVLADAEALEQALTHLVQNAVDASDKDAAVSVIVSSDGVHGRFEVVDQGEGMSPAFVRNGLFKPFVSSKNGGFGIGAFEARELVRGMNGRLDVESREGLGTRFVVTLPLAAAARLISIESDKETKVA